MLFVIFLLVLLVLLKTLNDRLVGIQLVLNLLISAFEIVYVLLFSLDLLESL